MKLDKYDTRCIKQIETALMAGDLDLARRMVAGRVMAGPTKENRQRRCDALNTMLVNYGIEAQTK